MCSWRYSLPTLCVPFFLILHRSNCHSIWLICITPLVSNVLTCFIKLLKIFEGNCTVFSILKLSCKMCNSYHHCQAIISHLSSTVFEFLGTTSPVYSYLQASVFIPQIPFHITSKGKIKQNRSKKNPSVLYAYQFSS